MVLYPSQKGNHYEIKIVGLVLKLKYKWPINFIDRDKLIVYDNEKNYICTINCLRRKILHFNALAPFDKKDNMLYNSDKELVLWF